MIVFGDSLTSGENNGFVSFADYLGIEKRGISGSCLDEYSIYPVFNGGLLSQLHDFSDTVLLEYGINDAASLVTGYVEIAKIKVSIAKVYDLVKDAYFLMLSSDYKDMQLFSTRYAKYLNSEYLKDLYDIEADDFLWCYLRFCELMQSKYKTLYLLPKGFREYDTDGIHPNDKGYRQIAVYLKQQMRKEVRKCQVVEQKKNLPRLERTPDSKAGKMRQRWDIKAASKTVSMPPREEA